MDTLTTEGRNPFVTQQEIREAWAPQRCGNCGAEGRDALHDKNCQQLLCGECRKKKRQALAMLPTHIKLDRSLYLHGMVVAGTYYPKEA